MSAKIIEAARIEGVRACMPGLNVRTPQENQEDALLAAFRRLEPAERHKLIRWAQLRQSWRIGNSTMLCAPLCERA